MGSPSPAATKAVALGSQGGCPCSAQTASDTRPDAHGVKGDAVAGGGNTLAQATVGQSGPALVDRPRIGGADSCWGGGEPVTIEGTVPPVLRTPFSQTVAETVPPGRNCLNLVFYTNTVTAQKLRRLMT